MTVPMSDEQLDHDLRVFLAWQAEDLVGVPGPTEMTQRIGQRTRSGSGQRGMPQLGWVAAVGFLILALAGGAVFVGAYLGRVEPPTLPTSYEAIYVRSQVEADAANLVVIAVDPRGREREVTRVPVLTNGRISELGAVSTSGLLLVSRRDADGLVRYLIIDLKRPDADPIPVAGIEQDSEQIQDQPHYDTHRRPSVFWGPDEQVAIPWYVRNVQPWHLAYIDGRTGFGPSVDLPQNPLLKALLPHWASDGSGVLLEDDTAVAGPPSTVLRFDGTMGQATGVAPSTYSRHHRADGAALAWDATQVRQVGPNGDKQTALLTLEDGQIEDVAWSADGTGLWLVTRTGPDGRDVRIERYQPGSVPAMVATITDGPRDAEGSRPDGRFIGLAPDDSMLVVSMDRVTGTLETGGTMPVDYSRLIAPGTGKSVEIEGTFAGWMAVAP